MVKRMWNTPSCVIGVTLLIMSLLSNVENKIVKRQTLQLKADVQMNGVTGSVVFDSSSIKLSLSGTPSSVQYQFEVREFPVDYQKPKPCSTIGKIFRNFTATTSNLQNPITKKLALSGSNSIAGRSIRLSAASWEICATVDSYTKTAHARFTTVIGGDVFFRGSSNSKDVSILSELYVVDATNVASKRKFKIYDGSVDEALPIVDRCKNIGKVWNPNGITPSGCSQVNPTGCLVGDLSGKYGDVQVGVGEGIKSMFTDSSFGLGDGRVIGKALVLLDSNDQVLTCAAIRDLKPKEASFSVNRDGIRIGMMFKQTYPLSPTAISISYTSGGALTQFQICEFPVFPRLTKSEDVCSNDTLGPVFDPLASAGGAVDSTPDINPVGDLSKTYFSRISALMKSTNFTVNNHYLQLFGHNSVIGRSIRIQASNGAVGCCHIRLRGNVRTAIGSFKYPVFGHAIFQQDATDPWTETTVYISLDRLDGTVTKNHMWHIHKYPISADFTAPGKARCASEGGRFNPYNVYMGRNYSAACNKDSELRCQLGNLAGKHRNIDIGGGNRYFFTDVLMPLSGPMSIIGRTVDVHNPDGSRLSCADVILQNQPSVLADFSDGSGPTGTISLKQKSLYHATSIDVKLYNLAANAGGYHVHLYPVPYNQPLPCSPANVAGHFDPFGPTKAPVNGTGSPNQYEVGDLSGKFGLLTDLNKIERTFNDPSLSLTSAQSVIGRSLVIHKKDGSRWKCANVTHDTKGIKKTTATVIEATASFDGDIEGYISLSQFVNFDTGYFSNTAIEIDLKYSYDVKKITRNHNWHVHTSPTGFGMTVAEKCVSPHYNPFLANVSSKSYATSCKFANPLACELGDQSRKLGQYDIGGGKAFFTDVDLPLAGNFSVIGRSFVVHAENSGGPRIACADIVPESTPQRDMNFPSTSFTKTELRDMVVKILDIETWQVTVSSENYGKISSQCMKAVIYFPGAQGEMLLRKFDETPAEKFGKFQPTAICIGMKFDASLVLLLLGIIISRTSIM
ncbi:uncharacterized protein LOC141898776 [Tubulanus polymorphus]|uniref:uncharacterized protein LOC141898776 n=1 Tax=Tubulanus polymorphus TaxID=672921 RepID=UPI003DA3AC66